MRDGMKLSCTLRQPSHGDVAASGKFPGLVVEFTPYLLAAGADNPEAAFFARRGYNTLVCTLRGVGDSQGTWQHAFARQDGRDAHDLVEWLAVQPFSDGRIGQLGESYGGQTSYGAAVEQPPHLRAVAPMQPPANLYDDVIFPGGIQATAGGDINNWPPLAELLSLGAVNADDEYAAGFAHPTFDAWWQDRSLVGRHRDIQVPVLTIGGWLDYYFRSGTLTNIEGALDRTWAIYGQWTHLPPVDVDTCDLACVDDPLPSGVLLAWFDHWVMEREDAPIPREPTFVSFEGPKASSGGWRELSTWMPDGADIVSLQLGADGTLAQMASADGTVSFKQPSEANSDYGAAIFTTAPLEHDRVLLGWPMLDFRATLSAPDANFYVELLDVGPDVKETFVNDGFLKASHHLSHSDPKAVAVGEAIHYHIKVRAQHYRFAAGHRVRLRITSGLKKNLVQPEPVEVAIEAGAGATLRMPGFGAAY